MGTETSWHYETGLFKKIGKSFDMKLSAYYIDIKNYLVYNTASNYYTSTYAYSIPSMKFYGFEGEFNMVLFDRLNLFGNYSFRESEYEDRPDISDAATPYFIDLPPKHMAGLGIRYELPAAIRFSSDIKYVGSRKSEAGVKLDDYVTVDIGLSKTFSKFCKVSVFATNIFGENYQEVYGYPAPGQTYGVQMELTF